MFQRSRIINMKWFNQKPAKRLSKKEQSYFLKTLYELLSEGFSLNQSLVFMTVLMPKAQHFIQETIQQFEQGRGLDRGLKQMGFSLDVIAQIYYSQKQGRFLQALKENGIKIEQKLSYQNKLVKVLVYPTVMFVFLIVLLLGMRIVLLPHILSFISEEVLSSAIFIRLLVVFFMYLPQILLGIVGVALVILAVIDLWLIKKPPIVKYQILLKFPIIKRWIRCYCTSKVCSSLGYFIQGGFSLQQTLSFIIQYPIDPFLSELAKLLQSQLLKGETLSHSLTTIGIFQQEMEMIIYQGELTSQVAVKCLIYAEKLMFQLMEDIAKKLTYIQPILFIIIALLVMAMYLLMMLPMLTLEGL